MEELCAMLSSCSINFKPKLYDMIVYDFIDLSIQYQSTTLEHVYTFNINPHAEYASPTEINELLIYMQTNRVDNILQSIIKERYPSSYIDKTIIETMVDYYIECLSDIT